MVDWLADWIKTATVYFNQLYPAEQLILWAKLAVLKQNIMFRQTANLRGYSQLFLVGYSAKKFAVDDVDDEKPLHTSIAEFATEEIFQLRRRPS